MQKEIDIKDLEFVFQHTLSLWEPLRGKKILITGGTGFFGHWLVESLIFAIDSLKLDMCVNLLSRNPQKFRDAFPKISDHSAINLLQGDIQNFPFPDGEFPFVIHAATEASQKLTLENPLQMFDTILNGTRHILDFASQHGTQALLFTSSGAVYGKQPSNLSHISEDYIGAPDPVNTRNVYGEAKRAAELLCALYSKQFCFEIKIARCFAFVGPFLPLDTHFAVGNFILNAINGDSINVKGDGTPYRSYLYAADLAVWLWTIFFTGVSCRPYNVGSEYALSIGDLAQKVHSVLSPDTPVQISCVPNPDLPVERYVPDTLRARRELGLSEHFSLSEALIKTADWYRKVLRNDR